MLLLYFLIIPVTRAAKLQSAEVWLLACDPLGMLHYKQVTGRKMIFAFYTT